MNHFLRVAMIALTIGSLSAQSGRETIPPEVREILNTLHGDFKWEMIRPSDGKTLRTGTKTSRYHLDSLVLFSGETFDASEIEQVAFFGYNHRDSLFFSVGIYNIDPGPHLTQGFLTENESVIEFQENDSSRLFLEIIDTNQYNWTYKHLKDKAWRDRDLEITFKRIQ